MKVRISGRWWFPFCLMIQLTTPISKVWGMKPDQISKTKVSPVTQFVRFMTMPGEMSRNLWFNWGDVHFYNQGWAIQRHYSGVVYRILNDRDHEIFRGTFEECRAYADKHAPATRAGFKRKVVILLHGIWAPGWVMRKMQHALTTHERQVVIFDYPSPRVPIEESAEYLRQAINSMQGVEEIDLVCHSMGGIVARKFLNLFDEPRVKNLITLGTPNQGAEMASYFSSWPFYDILMGPAGKQLVHLPTGITHKLEAPKRPWGVIAGGRGRERGFNPLINGDNDGTVTVSSSQDPGMTDFLLVPGLHNALVRNPRVINEVDHFLRVGHFSATAE
jgi:pimeloyl-ACP methyl ester carboxylesterase